MKEAVPGGNIKELMDYTQIKGELYRRIPGGILSRCITENEGKLKLEELHTQACGVAEKVSLYRRMHGVLLAIYEQGGSNYTGEMSGVSFGNI